jgi:hypothetical protein
MAVPPSHEHEVEMLIGISQNSLVRKPVHLSSQMMRITLESNTGTEDLSQTLIHICGGIADIGPGRPCPHGHSSAPEADQVLPVPPIALFTP